MNSRRALVLPLLGVVLFSLSAFADDPPGRVARLDYTSGQVSIQPNGANEWVAANINRPLTTSDRIWTDKESRAELQMGAASARLNSETSLTLANVSYHAVQLQLDQGTLDLHVLRLFEGEIYEVDTPNLAFTVEKAGDYRFDVDNAGDTTGVTVWKGRGEATGDNPGIVIKSHQQMTFHRGRSLDYVSTNAPAYDGFDSWCLARVEREDRSPSLQYVSPYAVGYSDLDDYGYWQSVEPYGPVWVPRGVAVGWAPYRWGHWVYVAPWGWTWVDDAPWGFTPFHYGRWVDFGNYWGWCPGPIGLRPIWAPALVAWIGGPRWGGGLSFGIGGGVGWFPLGWGEPYIPWYGHSRNYFQNVNVTNTHITNIVNVTNNYYGHEHPVKPIQYVNQHPDRITAVSNGAFTGSRPTRESFVPVTTQAMNGATTMSTVPVRPTRESVTGPAQHTTPPPSQVFNRPVVTKMTPPTPAAAPVAGIGRPDRNAAPAPGSTAITERPERGEAPAATATAATDRPSRGYSRPPENTSPSMATEETPRGVPHPPSEEANRNVTPSAPAASAEPAMPSRVPRPPASLSTPINKPAGTQTVQPTAPSTPARSYPRPGEGVTPERPVAQPSSQPASPDRPSREAAPNSNLRQYSHPEVTPSPVPQNGNREERPSRSEPAVSQPSPRPNVTPTPAPSVSHEDRPISRPAETHAPAPAPAPKSEPSHELHPDHKDNSASPKAGLRYPSPYNSNSNTASVRPASLTRSYPHPSGPVASAPHVSTASFAGGSYASAPRGSYSSRVPTYSGSSHYGSAPRYSGGASVAHYSHSAAPTASRSSGSGGNHAHR